MCLRAVILSVCVLFLACGANGDPASESEIYVSAIKDLAPAVNHFNIAAEKVIVGVGELAPTADQIDELGTFVFPDSGSLFATEDFPGLAVTLLHDSDFGDLNSGDCESFWRNYRSRYEQSTGYFRLSSVGFDSSGTKAILYIAGHGGCLSGQGALVVMVLEDDRWVVAEKKQLWVS